MTASAAGLRTVRSAIRTVVTVPQAVQTAKVTEPVRPARHRQTVRRTASNRASAATISATPKPSQPAPVPRTALLSAKMVPVRKARRVSPVLRTAVLARPRPCAAMAFAQEPEEAAPEKTATPVRRTAALAANPSVRFTPNAEPAVILSVSSLHVVRTSSARPPPQTRTPGPHSIGSHQRQQGRAFAAWAAPQVEIVVAAKSVCRFRVLTPPEFASVRVTLKVRAAAVQPACAPRYQTPRHL